MLYYTLYVISLILHVVFMSYVLAGSLYLAASEFRSKTGDANRLAPETIAGNLRDWMPFVLGAAITAGVAPLLFLQMVHQRPFYTANLLLSHRWMILLPLLIVAFYLFYLLKTQWLAAQSFAVRIAVATSAAACVLYAAYSWTRNHLVCVTPDRWTDFYVNGVPPFDAETFFRLGFWIAGAFVVLALEIAAQLQVRTRMHVPEGQIRRVMGLAFGGLGGATILGILYVVWVPQVRSLLWTDSLASRFGWVLLVLGAVPHVYGWWLAFRSGWGTGRFWVLGAGGLVLMMLGISLLREGVRIGRLASPPTLKVWPDVELTGFAWFVAFALINGLLIGWTVRLVRHRVRPTGE